MAGKRAQMVAWNRNPPLGGASFPFAIVVEIAVCCQAKMTPRKKVPEIAFCATRALFHETNCAYQPPELHKK
jgi:hypothetical protein